LRYVENVFYYQKMFIFCHVKLITYRMALIAALILNWICLLKQMTYVTFDADEILILLVTRWHQ